MYPVKPIDKEWLTDLGRGGGQVVSVLTFYFDDPSSNPTEAYIFYVKVVLKNRPGLAHIN